MKFLNAGTRVTLVRPQIREALDIALERRYRDVKERDKNPNKVKDYQSSPLHPILIGFMGAAGEWAASHAITTLSGHTIDNDLTTHPRAGSDDITTPTGLPIDVKTRQGKPGERDLICPTTEGKVRELTQGRCSSCTPIASSFPSDLEHQAPRSTPTPPYPPGSSPNMYPGHHSGNGPVGGPGAPCEARSTR